MFSQCSWKLDLIYTHLLRSRSRLVEQSLTNLKIVWNAALKCRLPADSPVFSVCPVQGRWLSSRADPDTPPHTQGVEEVGQLTPVITAQSDTVTRRNMTETRMAPFMVTWGEVTTPAAPLPLPCSRSASRASWGGLAVRPLPSSQIYTVRSKLLVGACLCSSLPHHRWYSDDLRDEQET